MQLVIDTDRCSGHGRCYSLAPALVQPDDEGFPVLIDDVPPGSGPAAETVVRSCPEGAVTLRETW